MEVMCLYLLTYPTIWSICETLVLFLCYLEHRTGYSQLLALSLYFLPFLVLWALKAVPCGWHYLGSLLSSFLWVQPVGSMGRRLGQKRKVGGPPFLADGVAGHSSCVEAFPPHALTSIALTYPSHIILIFSVAPPRLMVRLRAYWIPTVSNHGALKNPLLFFLNFAHTSVNSAL